MAEHASAFQDFANSNFKTNQREKSGCLKRNNN